MPQIHDLNQLKNLLKSSLKAKRTINLKKLKVTPLTSLSRMKHVIPYENGWIQSAMANNIEINLTAPNWMAYTDKMYVCQAMNRKSGINKYIYSLKGR